MAIIHSFPYGPDVESPRGRDDTVDRAVVLEALRARLESPWWVLCDRVLETRLGKRTVDFVLAHPMLGIILLTLDGPSGEAALSAPSARAIFAAFLDEAGFFDTVGGPIALRQLDLLQIESEEALRPSLIAAFETGEQTAATDPDWVEALADLLARPDDHRPAAADLTQSAARPPAPWRPAMIEQPAIEQPAIEQPAIEQPRPIPLPTATDFSIQPSLARPEIAPSPSPIDRRLPPLDPAERSPLSVDPPAGGRRPRSSRPNSSRPNSSQHDRRLLLAGLIGLAAWVGVIWLTVGQRHPNDMTGRTHTAYAALAAWFTPFPQAGGLKAADPVSTAETEHSSTIVTTAFPPLPAPLPPGPSPESSPSPPPAVATDPSLERDFWKAVKDSNDPAMFEAHIQHFPNGFLAPLARVKLKELQDKTQARAALQVPPPAAQATPAPGHGIEAMEENFGVISGVIIREQPTGNARRLGLLDQGQTVLVTGRVVGANWFRVETDDGKIGYVYGPNLRKSEGAPVASGPSSPPAAAPAAQPAAQAPPTAPERAPERLAVVSPPLPPARPAAAFKDCENCPEMITLPAGGFMMGSADGDASERPVHRVALGAFALGRTVVTAKLWMACVGDGGCAYRPRTDLPDNAPINNLSWQDAQHYVEWLAKTTGRPYRLPTEAEWEYAARAGTETRYWWGGQPGVAKADCKGCGGDWNTARPAAVGSFAPNPFGLYDMNGGVAQWVADCWSASYDKAPADGSARGGSCAQHVLRGGAWKNDPSYLTSSSRAQYDTDVRYITNGLRVAKTLP